MRETPAASMVVCQSSRGRNGLRIDFIAAWQVANNLSRDLLRLDLLCWPFYQEDVERVFIIIADERVR